MVLLAGGFIFGAAGIITLLIAVYIAARIRSFTNDSAEVSALVTKKYSHRRKNGTAYEVTFEYDVGSEHFKKTLAVAAPIFNTAEEGRQFTIRYKPQNPKRIAVPAELDARNVRIPFVIGAVLFVPGVIMFIIGVAK